MRGASVVITSYTDHLDESNRKSYKIHYFQIDLRYKSIVRGDLQISIHIAGFIICDVSKIKMQHLTLE